jgi:hypothetical protein
LLKRVVGETEIKLVEESEPGRPPMENLLTLDIGKTRNASSLVPAKQKE